MLIFIIGLVFHLLVSAVIFILIKTDIMKISAQLFPMVLLVPVFGTLMVLSAEFMSRRALTGQKSIEDIHDFTLEQTDYRKRGIHAEDGVVSVVPIEEAISINDAKTRREFMMDIITENSQNYISLLQKARFNDDVDVAHYASTAIMELQRDYELKIQKCQMNVMENPEDPAVLDALILAYKNYIDSGLIEDNVLSSQRGRYHDAIIKRIAIEDPPAEPDCYHDAVDNQLELGNFVLAEQLLDEAFRKWSNIERVWLLKLKLCFLKHDPDGLRKTLGGIEVSKVFLSAEAREEVLYWSRILN